MNFAPFRILFAITFSIAFTGCGYNSLPADDENVSRAWSNLDATYRRRADLIPNLVSVVKGYAKHEASVFEKVTEMRSKAGSISLTPADLEDTAAMLRFQDAQRQLSGAFTRLLAVTENYPELKADQGFRDLMSQLEGTENRINVAIQDYNAAASTLNTHIRQFPSSLTNSFLLHIKPKPYFAATSEEKKRPDVSF